MFHVCLPANYANSWRWLADCKVECRRESNQISVLLNPAMNVHSEEHHPRQTGEGRRGLGKGVKGKHGEEVPSLEGD